MYLTSARRVLLRPLLRQSASRIPRKRCIATAESNTPSQVSEIDLENLAGPVASTSTSTSTSASLFAPLPDDPVISNVIDDDALFENELKIADGLVNPEQEHLGTTAANESNDAQLSHSIQVFPELKAINMPGILTIVREIESRFGPVREFRMIKDKDVPGEYLRGLFLNFKNKESVQKIKDSGISSMVIPIARWDRVKDGVYGGVGLDEVQANLRPARPTSTMDSPREDEARVEADVGAVEDALNAAEGKPAAAADPPVSLPATEPCECRIYILSNQAFVMKPVNYEKPYKISADTRERISRSLIRWGGFYQPVSEAEKEENLEIGMEIGERGKLVETKEERAEREIRAMVSRAEKRLEEMGLDWRVPAPLQKKKEADMNSVDGSQDTSEAVEATPVSVEPVKVLDSPLPVKKPAQTQTKSKAKALTPEEMQLLGRLAVRTPKKVTTTPEPAATVSSTPNPSTPATPTQKVQKPKAPSTPPIAATTPSSSSPSTSATPASPSTDEARRKEVENNRARRAARKAEEEERAGFKAKLLGWIGR